MTLLYIPFTHQEDPSEDLIKRARTWQENVGLDVRRKSRPGVFVHNSSMILRPLRGGNESVYVLAHGYNLPGYVGSTQAFNCVAMSAELLATRLKNDQLFGADHRTLKLYCCDEGYAREFAYAFAEHMRWADYPLLNIYYYTKSVGIPVLEARTGEYHKFAIASDPGNFYMPAGRASRHRERVLRLMPRLQDH